MSAGPFHPVAPYTERLSEAEHTPTRRARGRKYAQGLEFGRASATLVRCSRAHLCNVINGKVRRDPASPNGNCESAGGVLFRRESLEQWLREVEATGRKRAASQRTSAGAGSGTMQIRPEDTAPETPERKITCVESDFNAAVFEKVKAWP